MDTNMLPRISKEERDRAIRINEMKFKIHELLGEGGDLLEFLEALGEAQKDVIREIRKALIEDEEEQP